MVSLYRGPLLLAYDPRFDTLDAAHLPDIDVRRASFLVGRNQAVDQHVINPAVAGAARGVPGRTDTVALCGTCHSNVDRMRQYQIPTDQYAKYWTSVHGQRLAAPGRVLTRGRLLRAADPRVARARG